MTPATTAPTAGVYTGTLRVEGLDGDGEEFSGVLLLSSREDTSTPIISVHIPTGDRTFGAELTPDEDGTWSGHEKRRVPHRFELTLEGAWQPDEGEFWVWGVLQTPDMEEDGQNVRGQFPIRTEDRGATESESVGSDRVAGGGGS